MNPENYDWSQFRITYYYNAHITRVFRVWTTAPGLESFLLERCVYSNRRGDVKEAEQSPAAGDYYEWQFRQDFSAMGAITTYIEKQQFSFTFGGMQVDIYFRVLDNQTEVELVQSNIPLTKVGQVQGHLNCRSCWVFFMTNLTSILDYGRDLRDENPALVSSMEVGFIPMTEREKQD